MKNLILFTFFVIILYSCGSKAITVRNAENTIAAIGENEIDKREYSQVEKTYNEIKTTYTTNIQDIKDSTTITKIRESNKIEPKDKTDAEDIYARIKRKRAKINDKEPQVKDMEKINKDFNILKKIAKNANS